MEKKLIKSIFLRFKTNNIRLKIQCPQGRAGSTPAAGIVEKTRFSDLVFFFQIKFKKILLKIGLYHLQILLKGL